VNNFKYFTLLHRANYLNRLPPCGKAGMWAIKDLIK
jgi:hypothetical protein